MRVLWTSNILFPEAASAVGEKSSVFGGWMTSLADDVIKAGVKLAVVSLYTGNQARKVETAYAVYYLLPGLVKSRYTYVGSLKKHFQYVLEDFKPDLIHVHGTEYTYPLPLVEVSGGIPVAVSIQGMIGVYELFYLAGIPAWDIIRFSTFADYVRTAGVFFGRARFRMRSKFERRLIASVRHVIGRTEWDFANTWAINPSVQYHKCNESLRPPFYSANWSLESCSRHTIFTSQASYPIKGVHMLLQAIGLLKTEYPDIQLHIAGPNITNKETFRNKLSLTGYGNYLLHLIRKYDIYKNVVFTGSLSAEAMAERLAASHVFVLASSIENSPNSLGEAQLVGTPCIASYVGGVADMVTDGEDGLLYNYMEPAILANKIKRVFSDDDLAQKLSVNGRVRALMRHDHKKNLEDLLAIYSDLTKGKRN